MSGFGQRLIVQALMAALLLLRGPWAFAAPVAPLTLEKTAAANHTTGTLQERWKQPITADFHEVDFASAVGFLSDSSGVNIILSQKAKELGKPVTVHLVEMPLERVLTYLLQSQGLLYRFDHEAIWVATKEEMLAEPMETRVFFLNQGPGLVAAFEPMKETRESVALEGSAVKAMTTMKEILEEVIPKVGDSSVLLDERSGAMIVTHVPYYLQQVETLLSQLDMTPVQILIEARFLEVTGTDTKEWGFNNQLNGNAALTKTADSDGKTKGPGLQFSSVGTTLKRGTKSAFTAFDNQTAGNALNLTLQGVFSGVQYSSILHSLMEHKKTKTLSAPRVTTLNNQTATIKVVTEFVYATQFKPTVVQNFDKLINGKPETKFVNAPQGFLTKDLGILLNVTPSVGRDLRTITLALRPEVSEKKTDDSFNGGVTLPRFASRNLETTVVIQNGETVMLGGLMKDTTGHTVTKVPFFGSLPVVGKLFRKESDTSERSNLLIFVTAQLVNPSGARMVASTDRSTSH